MSKKRTKNKKPNQINIGERRTIKKKVEQRIPFDRIKLHPVEELEAEMIALRDHKLSQTNVGAEQPLRTEASDTTTESQAAVSRNDLETSIETSTSNLPQILIETSAGSLPQNTLKTSTSSLLASSPKTSTAKGQETFKKPSVLGHPVSPSKDFQKVPNSIIREALPARLFRGKSKLVWDYLWSISRGAVKPSRIVRRSRREIMKSTGIGSMVTVDAALRHLQAIGLLRKFSAVGCPTGNEYELLIPEERNSVFQTNINETSTTSITSTQPILETSTTTYTSFCTGCMSQTVENATTYEAPKTFIKTYTKNDDDRRFATLKGFFEIFDKVFKEITGKGIEQTDAEALKEIAQLLTAELREARTKTKAISRPAAFLAQHMKSRLSKPVSAQKATNRDVRKTERAIKPDTVGKTPDPSERVIDLTDYSTEEIEELKREFCMVCGKRYEECICRKNTTGKA